MMEEAVFLDLIVWSTLGNSHHIKNLPSWKKTKLLIRDDSLQAITLAQFCKHICIIVNEMGQIAWKRRGLFILRLFAMKVELKERKSFPMDFGSSTTSDKYSLISLKKPSKSSMVQPSMTKDLSPWKEFLYLLKILFTDVGIEGIILLI